MAAVTNLAGTVVIWVIIIGFAATVLVTILNIRGTVRIESKTLTFLRGIVVAELVGAGFYLFYQIVAPPGFGVCAGRSGSNLSLQR